MGCIKGFFRWIYRIIIWIMTFFGLITWILMLPFILAMIYQTFAIALELSPSLTDESIEITGSSISGEVFVIGFVIILMLMGPYSVIRLIRDKDMPGCLYGIARFFSYPAKWIIRLYAFIAGFSAVMAVGLKFNHPQFDRLDSLALIFGTMFTAFLGYGRTIDRSLSERNSNRSEDDRAERKAKPRY